MNAKSFLFGLVLLLGLAGTNLAAVTRDEARAAIAQLEDDIVSDDAVNAARVVIQFADESEDVLITLADELLPWLNEEWELAPATERRMHTMLLGAYVAGNVKSQLAGGKAVDDPYAGWLQVCRGYRELRKKIDFSSPSIEKLERRKEDGTLRSHARAVLRKAQAESETDYRSRPI